MTSSFDNQVSDASSFFPFSCKMQFLSSSAPASASASAELARLPDFQATYTTLMDIIFKLRRGDSSTRFVGRSVGPSKKFQKNFTA